MKHFGEGNKNEIWKINETPRELKKKINRTRNNFNPDSSILRSLFISPVSILIYTFPTNFRVNCFFVSLLWILLNQNTITSTHLVQLSLSKYWQTPYFVGCESCFWISKTFVSSHTLMQTLYLYLHIVGKHSGKLKT